MLEQAYWMAGIVVAAVAVIGLFLSKKSRRKITNRQNAKVSGKNNTVSQSSEIRADEQDDNK
ncbi:hypothetical protein [Halomonas alimentaria]|uniref:hypothetical protein n=1 Tax=Halomonas alimentaria TaxID=147248 RepID=UPI002490D847|nr:hypothetical protein [Halomonas alimentaria]